MATQARARKLDENYGEKNKKIQTKKDLTTVTKTKRAALGELGNKQTIKNVEGQKNIAKGCSVNNHIVKLKNAKPRVDTHWKKLTRVKDETGKQVTSTVDTTTTIDAAGAITMQTTNDEKVIHDGVKIIQKPLVKKTTTTKSAAKALPVYLEDINLTKKPLTQLKTVPSRHDSEKDKVTHELKIVSVQSHSEKLLNEVADIDADDDDRLILVTDYVNDVFTYLYLLEAEFPIDKNHLKTQEEVKPKMRAVLLDWLNEVHYQFHLLVETYHMTVAIIDRYLQGMIISLDQLQLVGITALFIAAKYEEYFAPDIADLEYVTDNTYDKFQIQEMEKKILKCLDFQLGRPLPIHFLRRFSKAAKASEYHYQCSKYFLELASIEYSLAHYKPSEIAAASLLLSLKLFKNLNDNETEKFWTPTLEYYSRYDESHLLPIIKKIAPLVKSAPNGKLKAVYTKYQSPKFKSISTHAQLKGSIIEELSAE